MRRNRRGIFPLFIELIVVFCGVYLAFWLNSYQEAEADKKRKIEYCTVFVAELQYLSRFLDENITRLDSTRRHYKSQITANKQPELKPVHTSFDYKGVITSAVSQDESFDALGVNLITSIALGTNSVYMVENRFRLYESYTQTILVPNLGKEKSEFYNLKTGELNEKYRWYLDMMAEVVQQSRYLKMVIDDRALPDVRNTIEALRK